MRIAFYLAALAALAGVVVIGLGQASDQQPETTKVDYDHEAALRDLEGAPAPLAALHAQDGELLDGGQDAFDARVKELRGHPIVINKWGSWCGPCRLEFPIFQDVSARKGKEVAFLGINGADNRDNARAFLDKFPVSYPSYVDDDDSIARAYEAPANFPITVFYDRRGRFAYAHAGQYKTTKALEADIKRYLGA